MNAIEDLKIESVEFVSVNHNLFVSVIDRECRESVEFVVQPLSLDL